MTTAIALAAGALVAAVLLVVFGSSKLLAGIAALAAAFELGMALGLLRFQVANFPLGLLFPLLLAVPGVLAWLRSTSKPAVSAAAVVAFVGILQVALYLTSHST